VLLAAPDESALFTVLPGQKYLMQGQGYTAVILTTAGGAAALLALLAVGGPLAPAVLPAARRTLQPHMHWMVWCVICFMLLSEWPKEGRLGQGGMAKFRQAWQSLGVGLAAFGLSGLLGFILLYRSPISHAAAFQNLMPAFVGLFAVPSLLVNLASRVNIPRQARACMPGSLTASSILRGTLAGALGGGFAGFVPAVTGGVGGMLAGHATALRDDRSFLVSQGASKLVYYVGGFLLLFVPGLWITRGGGAWLLKSVYAPRMERDYWMALASAAIGGAVALALVSPLTRATIRMLETCGYRRVSWAALALMAVLVAAVTGWAGLAVAAVGTGIGLLPILYGSRRMNCLGVILLPIACNLSGVGGRVAAWMGLL
jgi:putative membrane protein